MTRLRWAVAVALLSGLLLAAGVAASGHEEEIAFVYGVNAFTGTDYEGAAYPPNVRTIYLLADATSIVSPRTSRVYFWPLTNEFKVDWDAHNEVVEGRLEILEGDRLVATLEQTQYIIQYPSGLIDRVVRLHTGEEAIERYQEFDRQRNEYRTRVREYYLATLEHRQQLLELTREQQEGQEVSIPEPPKEPEPFEVYSTSPNSGFPVRLPAGVYTIQVRETRGQIVPESRRRLVVFGPRREGVGYQIIPQAKWTTPEVANEPRAVIYARPGTTLYIQPHTEREFNEYSYIHLIKPQSTEGSRSRWMWVHLSPQKEGYLEVLQGNESQRLVMKPWRVRQLPGGALGYEVVEYEPPPPGERGRSPDFQGYRLQVGLDQPSFTVRFTDPEGAPFPESERTVRLVSPQDSPLFFLPPAVPILLGLAIHLWRRWKLSRLAGLRELEAADDLTFGRAGVG